MAYIKKEQHVLLFPDDKFKALQQVFLETEDVKESGGFMSVLHNGYEICITIENWNKLVLLVEDVKKEAGLPTIFLNELSEDDIQP